LQVTQYSSNSFEITPTYVIWGVFC